MNRVHISKLKKGDVIFECSQHGSIEVEVKEPVVFKNNQWTFTGHTPLGDIGFLVTKDLEHYGPRFYKEPIYFPVERFEK